MIPAYLDADTLVVADYTGDTLHVFDTATDAFTEKAWEVGDSDTPDGLWDFVVKSDSTPDIVTLLNLSASLSSVNTADNSVVNDIAATGSFPNTIRLFGDRLFVVNPGTFDVPDSSAIDRLTWGTWEKESGFIVLPDGSNISDIHVADESGGTYAYINAYDLDLIYWVDFDDLTTISSID